MANYNVDIAVALKGAQKLDAFNKKIKQTEEISKVVNINMKLLGKNNDLVIRSFNSLSKAVSEARKNFNEAAIGTSVQKKAARELVAAQKDLNKELKIQEQILQGATLTGQRSSLKPGRSRTLLGQSVTPEGGVSGRSRKILAENQALQEALGSMNSRAFGRFKFMPPIQGTTESQLALKTRVQSNVAESQRIRNIVTAGSNRAGLGGGFLALSKSADKIAAGVKANVKQTTKTASLLAQQSARAAFTDMEFGVSGGQIGPATPFTRAERFGFGKRGQRAGGLFSFPGGRNARVKGGIGSALIGGGFPALFGAGGLSSLLGGIAGGAGGALSPGGGFAASIFATAIAGQIEDAIQFRKTVKSLNKQLAASGAITKISRKEIKELAKSLDVTKEKAIEVVNEFKKFADTGILDLSDTFKSRALFDATVGADDFQSTLSRIQTLSEDLTLGTEFKAYKILAEQGSEAANKFIKDQIFLRRETEKFNDLIEKSFKENQLKTFVRDFQRFGVGQSNIPGLRNFESFSGFSKEFNKLLNEVVKENKEIQEILNDPKNQILIEGTSKTILSSEAQQRINNILKPLLKDSESVLNLIKKFPEAFNLTTTKSRELTDALSKLPEALAFLQEFRAPDEELKKMLNPLRQILDLSVAIRDGFEESFKGIIKGTMTVSDAFRNMLNRIADHFLDTAARMAALQIQKGFLGLFSNMFNFDLGQSIFDNSGVQSSLNNPVVVPKAEGGPVKKGGRFLVGERGPELFTPGVSGMITPNHALGGSTNVVVNVDASGSSVEGDEQGGRELGRLISVAIQSELIQQKRPGGLLS